MKRATGMPAGSGRKAGLRGLAAAALLALASAALPALSQPAGGPAPGGNRPVREVGVITATRTEVPQVVTLPGRAVAYEVALVRPRVGGLIEAITYRSGDHLQAGAPMFRLETESLDAALAAAEAAEAGAASALEGAQATVARYRQLAGKGVSRAELETAEVALSRAEAELSAARAATQNARLDRDRAIITAPITGEASVPEVTIGTLVTANQADPLATVTRVDPIYVDVSASSARVLEGRQRIAEGMMNPIDPPAIALTLENGRRYEEPGEIVARGSTVSASTGTVDLRLQFPNPDRLVLPGQFLRVEMTIGSVPAVLVPQRATSRLADGSLSVFVARDGTAERVELTEAGVWNNAWAVTGGLEPGEAVIVDGLSELSDGDAIRAVPVTLDRQGVVADIAADEAPAGDDRTAAAATPATPAANVASPEPARPAASLPLAGRLKPWFGLRPDESLAAAAERRWQRLRGLLGLDTAGA